MDTRCSISYNKPQNTCLESDLIHAAAQGDLNVFNTLVQTYQDSIFTLAYHLAPPGSDAVRIAQTVVQSLNRELPGYRGEDFDIWMYKQLVKVCREAWKSKKQIPLEVGSGKKNGTKPPHPKPSPASELVGIEGDHYTSQEVIMNRLHDLPFELRLTVVLVDIEGLNYETTAEVLGKHKHEIRGRLGKARRYFCQPLLDDPHSFEMGI